MTHIICKHIIDTDSYIKDNSDDSNDIWQILSQNNTVMDQTTDLVVAILLAEEWRKKLGATQTVHITEFKGIDTVELIEAIRNNNA